MSAGEASSLASAQKRSRQEQQHDGPTIAVPASTRPEEGRASSLTYSPKMKGAGGGVPGVLAVPASMAAAHNRACQLRQAKNKKKGGQYSSGDFVTEEWVVHGFALKSSTARVRELSEIAPGSNGLQWVAQSAVSLRGRGLFTRLPGGHCACGAHCA